MPTDACVVFYNCKGCGAKLKPLPGSCCVFCSYGSVPCPPIQEGVEPCLPLIAAEVKREVHGIIEFRNGAALEVTTNDARLIRGRSALAVIATEACHWRTDADFASSDAEVLAAARPSMAMTPGGGPMVLSSTPQHRKSGVMFNRYNEIWGNDDTNEIV